MSGQEWVKMTFQKGDPETGSKKLSEKGCPNYMFWEGKNLEIYGTVTKIKVFGVLQKHQKMMPKRTPKMDKNPSKMEPWVLKK